MDIKDRITGSLLGFAIGDAMGITEFMTPKDIQKKFGRVTEMIGGGWLNLKPGQITDDTEMMLCVARSLVATNGIPNYRDMADRLLQWLNSTPKDVGMQTRRALEAYRKTGGLCHGEDDDLGNGALLRVLPFALANRSLQEANAHTDLTHCASLYTRCVQSYMRMVDAALRGEDKIEILCQMKGVGSRKAKVMNGGMVRDTLKSAFIHFAMTDTFEDCIISAVNAGNDADSVAAIAGGLAGAHYGVDAIPERWLQVLDPVVKAECLELAGKFAVVRG